MEDTKPITRLSILFTLGGIGLVFAIMFEPSENPHDNVLEAVKALLMYAGAVGVVLNTYISIKLSSEKNQLNIIENTFEILDKWDDTHLLKAREFTRGLKERSNDITKNELIDEINNKEGLKQSVHLVINYFDKIRVSLKYKRISKEVIKHTLQGVIIDMHDRFRPYVEKVSARQLKDWDEVKELIEK